MGKILEKSFRMTQSAPSARDIFDLKERMQLTGLIREATYTIQGNQVSTAGGAISGFAREAPWSQISLLTLEGNYLPTGKIRTVINAPAQEIYWPSSFMNGSPGTILTTSAGASATDPIRGVIHDFLTDEGPGGIFALSTYIDTRQYTDMTETNQWAADADYATTNLSDLTSLEIELRIKEEIGDLPSADAAHFEPAFISRDHPTTTSDTKIQNDSQVGWDGMVLTYFARQHDDSATGNSERVDGLVRRVTVEQGGRALLNNMDIQSLIRLTQKQYPLARTATDPAGVYAISMEPAVDSRLGPLNVIRDTTTTNPPGITAITPAAGDKWVSQVLIAEPNAAMDAQLVAEGVA